MQSYTGGASSVMLVLMIAHNSNMWGTEELHTIDALPLLQDFNEGDGAQSRLPQVVVPDSEVPGVVATRGSGRGVTWRSPDDLNVGDTRLSKGSPRWNGGDCDPATSPAAVHVNRMLGDVVWDVTQDVLNGRFGWLLQLTDDDFRDNRPGRDSKKLGHDANINPSIEYYSREGSILAAGDLRYAPRLIFTYA